LLKKTEEKKKNATLLFEGFVHFVMIHPSVTLLFLFPSPVAAPKRKKKEKNGKEHSCMTFLFIL